MTNWDNNKQNRDRISPNTTNRDIATDIVHGTYPYIPNEDAMEFIIKIELALDVKDKQALMMVLTALDEASENK